MRLIPHCDTRTSSVGGFLSKVTGLFSFVFLCCVYLKPDSQPSLGNNFIDIFVLIQVKLIFKPWRSLKEEPSKFSDRQVLPWSWQLGSQVGWVIG